MLGEGVAAQLLAEVFDHVVAFELAVHQHVKAERFLPAHRVVDPAFDDRFIVGFGCELPSAQARRAPVGPPQSVEKTRWWLSGTSGSPKPGLLGEAPL